jgi:hypothetical protein
MDNILAIVVFLIAGLVLGCFVIYMLYDFFNLFFPRIAEFAVNIMLGVLVLAGFVFILGPTGLIIGALVYSIFLGKKAYESITDIFNK